MSSAPEYPLNVTTGTSPKGPLVSNRTYDTIKQLVQKGLPALGALYAGLAVIWGLPNGEEVVGSIAALTVCLGVFLSISDRRYESSGAKYDGEVVVTGDPGNPHALVFTPPLSELENQKQIVLRVASS